MQGAAWIELLRRIPKEQHDCLILMTITGAEIMLQRLIRTDGDYMVVLGRLSGSTEQGKVLIVPYDQMTYLAINKQLSDDEIKVFLGNPIPSSNTPPEPQPIGAAATQWSAPVAKQAAVEAPPAPSATPISPSTPTPRPAGLPDSPAAQSAQKASPPSKSILLARLRQRLAEDISKQPK